VAAVLFCADIARHEERLLAVAFGSEYEDYKRDVPMLAPRLTGRRSG